MRHVFIKRSERSRRSTKKTNVRGPSSGVLSVFWDLLLRQDTAPNNSSLGKFTFSAFYIYICRVHHRATALDVFNKWHVAFHGTRVDSVNAILECGDLLIPGISFSI